MSKDRTYNIAIDMFMEKKVQHMIKCDPTFNTNLYYNNTDKQWILYDMNADQAKQVWERLVQYIKTTDINGLKAETCPFCIYMALNRYTAFKCTECPYQKHHNGFMCEDSASDYSKIADRFAKYFTTDVYRKFVREIEQALNLDTGESQPVNNKIKLDIVQKSLARSKVTYGDVVCWTESNEDFVNRPCLVTYSNIVLLDDPRQTWSFGHIGSGLLTDIEELIKEGQMRLMPECDKYTLQPPEKSKDMKHRVTFGDIVCWLKCDDNSSVIGKPCLVTFSNIVLLENPGTTWSSMGMDQTLLNGIQSLIVKGELRIMDEIESLTLKFA